jgi:allophanate hydrolase subunit 2
MDGGLGIRPHRLPAQGRLALAIPATGSTFGAGADPSNIVDAGYPIGSIQLPAGKEPIILLRDAVSGGGYAMLGTVISADLDVVGQLPPNQRIVFCTVDMAEALQARQQGQAALQHLRQALQG